MKKIINNLIYDSETAVPIASQDNGLFVTDFGFLSEDLYQTKKGNWFLHQIGGPLSPVATGSLGSGSGLRSGEAIQAISPIEAGEWLKKANEIDLYQAHFGRLEEA